MPLKFRIRENPFFDVQDNFPHIPPSGNNLSTYQGRAEIYRGCGARDSLVLPWKPVRKFEDSRFQIFTGVPVSYKLSSFIVSSYS